MKMNKFIESEKINNNNINNENISSENINSENNKKEIIKKIYIEMIKLYKGDAKRIQHFTKVNAYGKLIAELEEVSSETFFIIDVATLTHDIGIHTCEEKYGNCNGKFQEQEGPALAKELLGKIGIDEEVSKRVQYLIGHHHTYNNIDGIDYQILVEADFLVNLYEDGASKEAVETAYNKIFKTEAGKKICREMFEI